MSKPTGKIKMAAKLNGPTALLTAVITQAVNDYSSDDRKLQKDAAAYFRGPMYQNHMELLGLPEDWQPSIISQQ